MRIKIHGIFENYLEGDSKDWYESRVKNKNWRIGVANLHAINALTNNRIRAINVAVVLGDHTS